MIATNISKYSLKDVRRSTEKTKEYRKQRKMKIFKADMGYPEPQDSGYKRFNVCFVRKFKVVNDR